MNELSFLEQCLFYKFTKNSLVALEVTIDHEKLQEMFMS